MPTAHPLRKWLLIVLVISWIYLASSMLQEISSVALKFIFLGGAIAITEVLIAISIAVGEVFPFALGLVFFGTLLSNIPVFHLPSLSLPSAQSKAALALIACGVLLFSRWINDTTKRIPLLHGLRVSSKSTSHSDPYTCIREFEMTAGPKHHRIFDSLAGQRVISIQSAKKSILIPDEKTRSASSSHIQGHNRRDHKLPFWVR